MSRIQVLAQAALALDGTGCAPSSRRLAARRQRWTMFSIFPWRPLSTLRAADTTAISPALARSLSRCLRPQMPNRNGPGCASSWVYERMQRAPPQGSSAAFGDGTIVILLDYCSLPQTLSRWGCSAADWKLLALRARCATSICHPPCPERLLTRSFGSWTTRSSRRPASCWPHGVRHQHRGHNPIEVAPNNAATPNRPLASRLPASAGGCNALR
jgi:hypothetical protein